MPRVLITTPLPNLPQLEFLARIFNRLSLEKIADQAVKSKGLVLSMSHGSQRLAALHEANIALEKSLGRELNPRPTAYKAVALPTELSRHHCFHSYFDY
jgi:hypothetical protein